MLVNALINTLQTPLKLQSLFPQNPQISLPFFLLILKWQRSSKLKRAMSKTSEVFDFFLCRFTKESPGFTDDEGGAKFHLTSLRVLTGIPYSEDDEERGFRCWSMFP